MSVFVDYFTKWPEAFPAPDQTAQTIAKLFLEPVLPVLPHPRDLLSVGC